MDPLFSFPDYLLLFVSIFNLILCLFIFVNNPRNGVNVWFALFSFFISLWSICLLLFRNIDLSYAHFWMRASYISAIGIAVSFWYFVHFFPEKRKLYFLNSTLLLIFTTFFISFFFNPSFLSREVVEFQDGARTVVVDSFGYGLFSVFFLFFFFGAIVILAWRYKRTQGIIRHHSRLIMYSVLIAGSLGVFFNLILPSPFFQNFQYIHWGPFFTFLIVLSVAYGVARYQLMNIKALLAEVFVVILFLIQFIQVLLADNHSDLLLSVSILLAVIIVGVLFIHSVLKEVKRREEVTKLAHSLEKANLRLKELDRQKTEFLSIASHQLRTPLSIMKGYIELTQDGAYGKPTKKMLEVLDSMDESNGRLVKLIDEFLDITRIEQGRTKYVFEDNDMNKLIDGVVKELTEKSDEKRMKIEWRPEKTIKTVSMDGEKIRHVIFNYVDNAIKYSKKGVVKVSLEREDSGFTVRVKDSGIGFDKEDEVNFFQKFYRGKNARGTNVNGTGLGIYVCRKFVEKHGGHVWAKSKGIGRGSEFGFWIPQKRNEERGTRNE